MLSSFAGGTVFGERFGEAPLEVLALHGWGRSHRDFEAALVGFNAIALDLPGFGASPALTKTMSSVDFAHAIAPVLDEATAPVLLVGHSHGGRVSICLARLRPEKVAGIILIGAPVLRRASSAKPAFSFRFLKLLRRFHLVSEDRIERYRRMHGSADYQAAEGALRDTLVTVVNESFEDELRSMTCPALFLWGADDTDVPLAVAERAAELWGTAEGVQRPTVSVSVLPGIGHLVPTHAADALHLAIAEMLR